MDARDVQTWFAEYLEAFAACGRGESDDVHALMAYYGVPLVLTTDHAAVSLRNDEEVVEAVRGQIEGMRAAGYDRSETLQTDVVRLNATSVLYTAEFSRQRADRSEIARLRATYLITRSAQGRRISVLVVHSA